MRRALYCVIASLALVVALIGCGGGGGSSSPTPVPQTLGTASGTVTGTNLGAAKVLLDGTAIPVTVGADGAFEIPGIPPGTHVIDIVGPDGMHAGRASFSVEAGEDSTIDPITLAPTGQIVGIITKREGEALTPLAGVEVAARADIDWASVVPSPEPMQSDGTTDPVVIQPAEPSEAVFTATTETDGSYAIKGVEPGLYLVSVAVPGLESGEQLAWVEAGHTAAIDFELEPYIEAGVGTLDCTVYALADDGTRTPLEGVTVEAYPEQDWNPPDPNDPIEVPADAPFTAALLKQLEDGDGGSGSTDCIEAPDVIWRRFATITDASGHCSLNVPAGYCTVSAWLWGYEYVGQRVAVTDATTVTLSFDLRTYDMPEEPPLPPGREID